MRSCVTSCINHPGIEITQHFTSWCRTAGSGHRQLARQVGVALRDILSSFSLVSWMADEPRPLPVGTVLRFGSLNFVVTDNGYDMELLPAGANTGSTAPEQEALGPARATSAHGAVQGGTS